MLTKLWLASWNCENQFPPDEMIRAFIPAQLASVPMLSWPDVIAIGVQEGEPSHGQKRALLGYHSRRPQWLHEHVGALSSQYEPVGGSQLAGSTKGPINYQQLGLLVRRGVRLANLQFGEYRGSVSGKGGIVCSFQIDGKRIGIMSAHLDASTATLRRENLDGLVTTAAKLAQRARGAVDLQQARLTVRTGYDALFLMGDLNFRLAPAGPPQSANALSQLLATPQGLETLWQLDTLGAAIKSDPTWYGFVFPKPEPLFWPTYKREYKTRGANNPSLRFARMARKTAEAARAAYFAQVEAAKLDQPLDIAKRGEYDLGWLDRIGWLSGPAVRVGCEQFVDFPELVLSDHTPVLMKLDVR